MLSALLIRDLRLHWGALMLPGLLALGSSLAMHRAGEHPMTLLAVALWIALLVPHALHLREEHQGTLGDLRGLPVPDPLFVAFRCLEGLLSAALVITLHLGLLRLLKEPGAFAGLGAWLSPGWLWMVLLFLALPMPVTLRWGARGWIALVIGAFVLMGAWVGFVQWTGRWTLTDVLARRLVRIAFYLMEHPVRHAVILLGLCLACFPLSTAGLRRRDC